MRQRENRPRRGKLSSTSSGREDRELDKNQIEEGIHPKAQVEEETERKIHTREKKAFIHKLRNRITVDRAGDTHQVEEGIHPQAQVQEETEREIHIREKRAFIHK
jgi:hypothetical protein